MSIPPALRTGTWLALLLAGCLILPAPAAGEEPKQEIRLGARVAAEPVGWPFPSRTSPTDEALARHCHLALEGDDAEREASIAALRGRGYAGLDAFAGHWEYYLRPRPVGGATVPGTVPPMRFVWGTDTPWRAQAALDRIAGQHHAAYTGLYWHQDLAAARAEAKRQGKPLLMLCMLGRLDEVWSCANSRFFRSTLYSRRDVRARLRRDFVLCWHSVRAVPRITIDMGDGRVIERTVTGNSAHLLLTEAGEVIDALPGLYGGATFDAWLQDARTLHDEVVKAPQERRRTVRRWHRERYRRLVNRWRDDLGEPHRSALRLMSASDDLDVLQRRRAELLSRTDMGAWERLAAARRESAELDPSSRSVVRRTAHTPSAREAGRIAETKRIVEDPMMRLLNGLMTSIAHDEARNDYERRIQIHGRLSGGRHLARADWIDWIYRALFLMPLDDPWLGLVDAHAFDGLPKNAVRGASREDAADGGR